MGDTRFTASYARLRDAPDPAATLRAMSDLEVVWALAAASTAHDPYEANVLASEAGNRVERISAVLRDMGEGVYALDTNGVVTFLNPAAERILGWTAAELKGHLLHDKAHLHDGAGRPAPSEKCPASAVARTGRPFQTDYDLFVRRDGARVPVAYTATPVLRDGEPRGVVVVFRDVTRELEATRALRESEERYRRLVELAPDAVLVHQADRLVYVNPAGARLLGASTPEELVGRAMRDVVHPDDGDGSAAAAAARRFVRPDGDVVDVEITEVPIPWSGAPAVQLIVRDVTERRRVERERDASRARYEALFEQSPFAIQVFGADGAILSANSAWEALWGTKRSELEGYNILKDPQLEEKGIAPSVRLAFAGEAVQTPAVLYDPAAIGKEGRQRWVSALFYPVKDDGGAVSEVVLLLRDETERHEQEDRVQRLQEDLERRVAERTRALSAANAELESFGYSVSHDLRSPLRGIDYLAEALLQDQADRLDDTGVAYLRRIREEASRMTQLVNALLDLSRLSRAELVRRPVDLSRMARDVLENLRRREPGREVEVRVQDGLVADGDPRLLRVALENLLGNAWKFTSPVPRARIEVGRGERDAFFVRDNGVGFDPARAERLFSPFQRLHAAHEFEGLGVGLATVRRIARRHGGDAWAESEPGAGATFWFTL